MCIDVYNVYTIYYGICYNLLKQSLGDKCNDDDVSQTIIYR